MMTSKEIRQSFLDFFEGKKHKIVPSAPIVNKDDPSLLFTNAGMNQFKDFFLGNQVPEYRRTADTQKCLRVSGKQNDLEEVGIDSYHHTMFEMLGNWSFGDYFKQEAIDWAWELLTEVYKLDKNRLYVSVFEGDKDFGLSPDEEAVGFWKKHVPEDRILYFDKKDNFWEMGDTGPCGPCSEIHIDLRPDEERIKVPGKDLVNQDDPLVVEIWNLVFIQFNRKADGSLENLPEKHIDTGMGFERLCMAIQNKQSNYDTDVFEPFIKFIESESGKKYTYSYAKDAMSDIAMRVVADHLRAVSFTIADGQMPFRSGAGYVVRRILRRAVRYYYSFLDIKEPFLHKMVPLLAQELGDVFPEIRKQEKHVQTTILGEERAFLNTLEGGLKRLDNLKVENNTIDGSTAFEMFDTYGFPLDLTLLIASEKGWTVDEKGFDACLTEQKKRSQEDAKKEVGDWQELRPSEGVSFLGYDLLEVDDARVVKYRTVKIKDKNQFQIVLDKTPFYAESGGQIGDRGLLWFGEEKIAVISTQKENDLIVHIVNKLPENKEVIVKAVVDANKRGLTENNHSATHLLHAALRQTLGDHVQQRGSYLDEKYLRFDFSHHSKVTEEEIAIIERMVNEKIRQNIPLEESRSISIQEAEAAGAMMLFGEKYGEFVRMITFDPEYSRELCGGTHVPSTGKIGLFKLRSESSIATGIRRIEALTADKAEEYINKELEELQTVRSLFKNPKNVGQSVSKLQEENKQLKKEVEKLLAAQAQAMKGQLKASFKEVNGRKFLAARLPLSDSNAIKTLGYELEQEIGDCVIVFGAEIKGKPQLMAIVSKELTQGENAVHAGNLIREIAKEIKGGGGGQPFFATAGGKDVSGLEKALEKAETMV